VSIFNALAKGDSMRSTVPGAFLFSLFITASSFSVMADERNEIREKANALRREAAELSEKGNKEEAEKLERRSRELMEKAELMVAGRREPLFHKPEIPRRNPDIQHLKERLVDLMTAQEKAKVSGAENEAREISEQIAHIEKKLAHLASQHGEPGEHKEIPEQFRPQAEKLAMAARRMQHVRVAAENLKAAEMHDMAHELMKKADAMEQDIGAAKMKLKRSLEAASHERGPEPKGEVIDLRSENERLRRELNELREVVQQLQIKLDRESPVDDLLK